MASKIPQSDWDAIALRREKGETVAAIAQSYGCSAASIYGILKRSKDGTSESDDAEDAELPLPIPAETPVAAAVTAQPIPVQAAPARTETMTLGMPAAPRPDRPQPMDQRPRHDRPPQNFRPDNARHEGGGQNRPPRPVEQAAQRVPIRIASETPASLPAQAVSMPPALTAQLDADLRAQAEAAIETFRQAFDATLAATASGEARRQLHQASSDLMRVAARTTIVLARLDAISARATLPPMRQRQETPADSTQASAHYPPRRR